MKNKILFLAAVLLAITAVWFGWSNKNSTIDKEELRFAVDTGSVRKIFLADRTGRSITIERAGGATWLVNDSFPARQDLLKSLLTAIAGVEVKTRVSKAGFNNVVKALAADGVKCEIYSGDSEQPVMTYYVGGPTADQLGTFMMKEGADLPFICELPGFNGYLSPRYTANSLEWRDKLIYSLQPEEITKVRVHYPSRPDWSYSLSRTSNGFVLGDPLDGTSIGIADTTSVRNYLYLFRKVPFETEAMKMRKEEQDSLSRLTPVAELEVTDTAGRVHGLRLFPMPVQTGALATHDSLGNPLQHDADRFYATDPVQLKWWVLQHFTFDPLLRKRSDFLSGGKK